MRNKELEGMVVKAILVMIALGAVVYLIANIHA